jgi:hypothetical protein
MQNRQSYFIVREGIIPQKSMFLVYGVGTRMREEEK